MKLKTPEWLKLDAAAERGIFFGLIVSTVIMLFLSHHDNYAVIGNFLPYGILWTWVNPLYTTGFYSLYVLTVVLLGEWFQYRFFVANGRIPKFLFYLGWIQAIMWIRWNRYQNVTVTLLAPLGSAYPWFVIPFMLLQKIPFGWSWDLNDTHWNCAFNPATNPPICQSDKLILNINDGYFGSYLLLALWIVVPVSIWAWRRLHK